MFCDYRRPSLKLQTRAMAWKNELHNCKCFVFDTTHTQSWFILCHSYTYVYFVLAVLPFASLSKLTTRNVHYTKVVTWCDLFIYYPFCNDFWNTLFKFLFKKKRTNFYTWHSISLVWKHTLVLYTQSPGGLWTRLTHTYHYYLIYFRAYTTCAFKAFSPWNFITFLWQFCTLVY